MVSHFEVGLCIIKSFLSNLDELIVFIIQNITLRNSDLKIIINWNGFENETGWVMCYCI